mmetsp:Transcript_94352/g.197057  ORF Transcript_94352/g.197057 Transcript_94352/m.197057 type:complete len:84 (-) Transcript_94352:933-1184(-)
MSAIDKVCTEIEPTRQPAHRCMLLLMLPPLLLLLLLMQLHLDAAAISLLQLGHDCIRQSLGLSSSSDKVRAKMRRHHGLQSSI